MTAAFLLVASLMASANAGPLEAGAGAGPDAWIGNLDAVGPSDWSYARAGHLLERAGFGGTPEEIERLAAMTPQEAVSFLIDYESIDNSHLSPFQDSRDAEGRALFDLVDAPIHLEIRNALNYAMQHGEALGVKVDYENPATRLQEVANQGYFHVAASRYEMDRVVQWWGNRMLNTNRPLEEKMTLFWHGHFSTTAKKVHDYRKMLIQLDLLRENAVGNFRDLLVGISKDPAMLVFLDNRLNVSGHPNENFGREILELFSMGVGNYTEEDIREAARAFTGWAINPRDELQFVVRPALHDTNDKTVFGETGNFDGEDIADIILRQDVTARFMARKIYRYFVREDLSEELESELAAIFRDSGYEVKPLLATIFLSKDFYSPASYATQIKAPIHLIISTYKKLELDEVPGSPNFRWAAKLLGQEPGNPPNVAGWKGGRTWINPATLLERGNFIRRVFEPEPEPTDARVTYNFETRLDGGVDALLASGGRRPSDMSRSASMADDDSETGEGMRASRSTSTMQTYDGWDLYRSIAIGNARARQLVPPIELTPAEVDLTGIVKRAGVSSVDEVIDYLTARFLRVELDETRKQPILDHLRAKIEGDELDFSNAGLEKALRESVHLIMSLAEYQLS